MSGGPRATECFLRWSRGGADDGLNSFLAGLVGGLGVVFFSSIDVAMYICTKALEASFYVRGFFLAEIFLRCTVQCVRRTWILRGNFHRN